MPKGTYDAGATYNHLDWVRYNGKAWVCKADNVTNVTPTEGQTWTVLAEDGEDATAHGIPTGGTTGQVLAKNSNTDYDVTWVNQSGGGGSDDEQLIRDTVGWTGKNLLENIASTQTTHDITFTVNSDGSVSTSGTRDASGVTQFKIGTITDFSVGDSFTLSGCPSGGADDTFNILALSKNSGGTATKYSRDKGSGVTFEVPSNTAYIDVYIEAYYGTSMNDKVFRPMLRRSEVQDSTYEPYHADVKQTLRDAEVIEGKNLLQIPDSVFTYSQPINGVQITVTRDNSGNVVEITANGTATGTVFFDIVPAGKLDPKFAEYGEVIMSGCKGGSDSTYELSFRDSAGNRVYYNGGETWQGDAERVVDCSKLKDNQDNPIPVNSLRIVLRIGTGVTVNNQKFYPMLRLASETDPTYEPYYIPLKDSKFDRAEQRVLGAKNLLDLPAKSDTSNNVTINGNTKSGYTLTSASQTSASAFFVFFQGTWSDISTTNLGAYLGKMVTLSPTGTDKVHFIFGHRASGGSNIEHEVSVASETFLLPTDTAEVYFSIKALSGNIFNDTVYPMLRLASDPDDTYAPYAMTNRELTEALGRVTSPAWSDVSSKPFNTVNSGSFAVSDNDLRLAGNRVHAISRYASDGTSTTYGYRGISASYATPTGTNGTSDAIVEYVMKQTATASSYTFTNSTAITDDRLVDVYSSLDEDYETVSQSGSTITVTFAESKNRTVAIVLK